jgi:hypothetical protein
MTDDLIGSQLDGVTPNSPIGSEDDEHLTDEELQADLDRDEDASTDADASGTEDDDEKDGRDLNKLHREFSRKQEKFQREMTEKFSQAMSELTLALKATSQPSKPEQQDGNSLDNLSVKQLKDMRSQVPEEQKDAFSDYLTERIISEQVNQRTQQATKIQTFESSRTRANQMALDRYPQLKERGSEFRDAVAAELQIRGGKSYAESNPSSLLDVANEIASNMGVQAKATIRTRRPSPNLPNARKGARPVKVTETETMSDEQAMDIKTRLEGSIPGVKFDIKKIKERHKLYRDNQDLFVK